MSLFEMTEEQFSEHLKMLAEKKMEHRHNPEAIPVSCFAKEKESILAMEMATETKLRGLRRGFQLEIDMEDPCYA